MPVSSSYPPPPTPPFTKGPELRIILSYQLLAIYLRPRIVSEIETVTIEKD